MLIPSGLFEEIAHVSKKEVLGKAVASQVDSKTIRLPTLGLGDLIGDLHADDLVIVTARPGIGKTNLALQIAEDLELSGVKVMFFSAEMALSSLGERLWLHYPQTRALSFKSKEHSKKLAAVETVEDGTLRFADLDKKGVTPFRSLCKPNMERWAKDPGTQVFIFDHLSYFLNEPSGKFRDERLIVEETVRDMRTFAKNNRTPIILIAQPSKTHSDEEVTIDSIKGTSVAGAEASTVLVLDRSRKSLVKKKKEEEDEGSVYQDWVTLKVDKARHAQGNRKLKLYLDYETMKFVDWDKGGRELCQKHKIFEI